MHHAQVDGEPWLQPAAELEVGFRGTALMLRRLDSAPLARMAGSVSEALDACQVRFCVATSFRNTTVLQVPSTCEFGTAAASVAEIQPRLSGC